MSQISITNLTFAYDSSGDSIFEDVSFQIDTNWKLGFIGRNGRGKTTFLNLLLGNYSYTGKISASVAFEYFPFDVADPSADTLTVIERISTDFLYWELLRELSLLEVAEDVLYRPFHTLSNGEQTKVLLASLFLKSNSFLLLDEPTNHLDQNARIIVSNYLKKKSGFILVSHDRVLLDHCIDHVLSINKTNIGIQQGNFSSWLINKERQDAFELAENDKLKKEVKRLEKTVREKATWSDKAEHRKIGFDPKHTEKSIGRRSYEGGKSKKMMSRAKAIAGRQQVAIEEKSKLLNNLERADALKMERLSYHANQLVSLSGISIFYEDTNACRDVSFTIEQGDRIALCGKNGSGKSSILKLIMGEDICYQGDFLKGSRLIISYVSQDTSHLSGHLSNYASEQGIDESLFKTILRKLDFSRAQFQQEIQDFSDGQKKKVLLARSLCEKAHLYIWDEPLNYIDVISRMQIEQLLLQDQPTLLFVEHDSAFCEHIATRMVRLGAPSEQIYTGGKGSF